MVRLGMRAVLATGAAVITMGSSCGTTGLPTGGAPTGHSTTWVGRTLNNDAGRRPIASAAADFDNDGRLDIAVAYRGQTGVADPSVAILFQNDNLAFAVLRIGTGADLAGVSTLAVADVNADGRLDVVAACTGKIVYMRAGANVRDGNGWEQSIVAESNAAELAQWRDLVIADIDGANGLDIVACNSPDFDEQQTDAGRISWFAAPADAGSGDGWTRHDIDTQTRRGAEGVFVHDIDDDGRLDIASTAYRESAARIAWYKNPASPASDNWQKFAIGNLEGSFRIIMGDLNADQREDVVVTSITQRMIGWYVAPETPASVAAWTGYSLAALASTLVPIDIKLADVNGNGVLDLIVCAHVLRSGDRPAPPNVPDPDAPAPVSQSGILRWFSPFSDPTLQWLENNLYDSLDPVQRIAVGNVNIGTRVDVIGPLTADQPELDQVAWFENPEP